MGPHRAEGAEAGGGEIARDAAYGQGIAAVGRDPDFDGGIIKVGDCGVGLPGGGAGGEFDDAVVILAQAELALADQHASAFHAADFTDLQGQAGGRDDGAGRGEDGGHAGACVGRAADDLGFGAGADIDAADAEAVRIGVFGGFDDPGGDERGQGCRGIVDALHFQADPGERVGDLRQAGVGVEVVPQPGEGELHPATPSCSVTGARGEKA